MKNKIKYFKKFIFFFIFILIFQEPSISLENKIILKINNEIITSFDLENELTYLSALNPNLKKLDKKDITSYSKKSIIKEKIKKIEILNNFENPKIPEEFLEKLLKNIYITIGINNLKDFKKYLSENNVDYNTVLEKIETEALWNELIVQKFSKKIKIDEDSLRNILEKNINKPSKSYLMSEIFFELKKKEKVEKKYQEIKKYILEEGFENAALKYSISETSKIGGKLNWINENSLNVKIKKKLHLKQINQFTEPINVPGGFLILKINNIRKTKSKKNIQKELKKLIRETKNNQLNQFSIMYFNRIKVDMEINEF